MPVLPPGSYSGTTTAITIGTGSKTIATPVNLAYVAGSRVRVASNATPAHYIEGPCTAYSGDSMTINVTTTSGSGSFSDGNLTIAGNPRSGSRAAIVRPFAAAGGSTPPST